MFTLSRLASRAPHVLATFLVFSLASGVLGGILFYMDSVSPQVYHEFTMKTSVDMQVGFMNSFFSQNETTLEDIVNVLESYEEVNFTNTVLKLSFWEDDVDFIYRNAVSLGVNESVFENFPNAFQINSNVSKLTDNTCYLETSFMERYNLAIGDNYTLTTYLRKANGNYLEYSKTYTIVGSFTTTLFPAFEYYYYETATGTSRLRFITTIGGILDTFGNVTYNDYEGLGYRVFVKLNHDLLISEEPFTAYDNLVALRKKFEQATLPYAFVSTNDYLLLKAVSQYMLWSIIIRLVGITFSVPTLLMGILLVYYNNKLLESQQRRDIGTLKTRGATGWQAFKWVMTTAIIVSILGCTGAILMGVVSSLMSASAALFLVFDLSLLSEFRLLLSSPAIISVIGFSFVMGIIISLPSAIKALIMTPAEAHAEIEEGILKGEETLGNVGYDVIGLVITIYLIIPVIMIGYIGFSYEGLLSYMIVFTPFMIIFVLSFTRLFSRQVSSFKSRAHKIFERTSFIVGARLLSRTARMFKKSESIGVIFISLVFATGVFSSISATTGYMHSYDLYMFNSGADIIIEFKQDSFATLDWIDNITAINGVADATGVLRIEGHRNELTQYNQYSGRRNITSRTMIYGVDPAAWKRIGFWLPYFTYHGDPWTALDSLASSNHTVLTNRKPIDYWNFLPNGMAIPVYHDDLTVVMKKQDETEVRNPCTIVDVLASDDSGQKTYFPGQPDVNEFIVINLSWVHDVLNTTAINMVYIDLADNADYDYVLSEIEQLGLENFMRVSCGLKDFDESNESKASRSIYGIYTMDMLFSLIYLIAGMAIITLIRTHNMSKQLSVLRALGSKTTSLLVPLLIDVLLSLAYALFIGFLLGSVITLIIVNMPIVFMANVSRTMWFRLPMVVQVPIGLLISLIGLAIASSLFSSFLIIRKQLRKNIADDIKYME